jgi:Flp pilus assembly pilin Flp
MTCKIENKGSASLRKDQRGLSTVEYALLFVLIVGGSAMLWNKLGKSVTGAVTEGNAKYTSALAD